MIVNVCIADGIASRRWKQKDNFCTQCGKKYLTIEVFDDSINGTHVELVEGA